MIVRTPKRRRGINHQERTSGSNKTTKVEIAARCWIGCTFAIYEDRLRTTWRVDSTDDKLAYCTQIEDDGNPGVHLLPPVRRAFPKRRKCLSPAYVPTPAQIKAAADKIKRSWSDEETRFRAMEGFREVRRVLLRNGPHLVIRRKRESIAVGQPSSKTVHRVQVWAGCGTMEALSADGPTRRVRKENAGPVPKGTGQGWLFDCRPLVQSRGRV